MLKEGTSRAICPRQDPAPPQGADRELCLAIASAALQDDPGIDRPVERSALRAQRALAVMHAQADETVSITDIAEQVGIGTRCLQIAFAQHFGMTPREMLTRLRLERARERLLAAEPGARVTTIALDAGFTHLSRFAVCYHQAFGERPVETLRRVRAEPLLRAAE